jgi:hypothetical protein
MEIAWLRTASLAIALLFWWPELLPYQGIQVERIEVTDHSTDMNEPASEDI